MPKIVAEIRVKATTTTPTVWRLFPGEGYRFYDEITENGNLFLDLPGLELPSKRPIAEIDDLYDRVVFAKRVRRAGNVEDADPVNVKEVRGFDKWNKSDGVLKGSFEGLFGKAKKGDIVVVPGPHYAALVDAAEHRPIFIGEFIDDVNVRSSVEIARYEGAKTPARRVKWLTSASDADLGYEISAALRTSNPFVSLRRSAVEPIISLAYSNYWSPKECKATFEVAAAHGFRSSTSWELQTFMNACFAAFQEADQQKTPVTDDFFSLAGLGVDTTYDPEQDVVIRSPGSIVLKLAKVSPIVSALIFALATDVNAQDIKGFGEAYLEIKVDVGADAPEECEVEIIESTRRTLEFIGLERWKKMCELGVAAQDGSEISVDAEATNGN